MADKSKRTADLPDHGDRYEFAADEPRNMRHEDGVVQQKVQLTPPGEPTHVAQRKHDVPGYSTVHTVGHDVPAFNPDAPPVGLREDELDVNPFGLPVGSDEDRQPTEPQGLTRLTEPADGGQEKVEGDSVKASSGEGSKASSGRGSGSKS